MTNISDYILEEYYKNIYPNDLNTKRITIPNKYEEYAGKYTYITIARIVTFEHDAKQALKVLHQQATKQHKPKKIKDKITKKINFPKSEGELLSEYALRVFNDTHALDTGTKLRNELNKFLQKTYNSTDLENIGIVSNYASSTVWSYKVTTNYGYTGTNLLDIKNIPLLNNKAIWIFENINTAQRIIQNELDFPFIITAGRPTKAFHELIKRLIKMDITLYYHGDMDKAGVNMLKSLKEKYPNLKAPFMTTSEFEKHTKTKAPKHQHYLTDGLSVLEMMIHNSNKVVYEEQLDLTKCLNYIK